MRIPFISLAAVGAIALGGCTYGGLGLGYGYGDYGYGNDYQPYGYYGSPYYGAGYYGSPYFGWYDNFYYPGTGTYVYDSYRRPHVWNDRQRHYWVSRQPTVRNSGARVTRTTVARPNWSGFNRSRATSAPRQRDRPGMRPD